MTFEDFISSAITGQAEEPMSLFISYAHREALICRLIVHALKARGHKVWFDELNIPHDSDWRSEIIKGIEGSGSVLSMLSREAVNPGGVCLDELTIAVGVRGGNIRTVLLEKDVTPPPTITFRQWLDLTEWQSFKKDNAGEEMLLSDPAFALWFKEKITLLIGALETRENREFEGQITVIRNALPSIYMATSKQMFLLKEFHIERSWLREKTESWLDDPDGESTCVIYGEPGIGKSAFAAHYAHYNGRVAAAIFCEKGQNTLNSPKAIIQTLAYMLACRIDDYRTYLADLLGQKNPEGTLADLLGQKNPEGSLEEFAEINKITFQSKKEAAGGQTKIGALNADELFEVLLATPLLHLIKGNRPVECILVDGLDEAGSIQQNDLASVLDKYADRLPRWLRILVLSRNVPGVRNWFGNAREMDLTAEIKENREDLEEFVRQGLKNFDADLAALEKAAEAIVSRSDGVFLYAKMAINALCEGKVSLEEADSFPRGLNQIFLRWFQWYFPDPAEYNTNIRPAINLIMASPEPIPEEEMIEITGWKWSQLGEFKNLLQVHLSESTNVIGRTTLDFNHVFIREWLESPAAGEYRIFTNDGILEMAEFFDGILSDSLRDDETEINEYEALNIPQIMESAAAFNRPMRRAYKSAMRNEALMKRQEKLGKRAWEWNLFSLAGRYLQYALQIAECRTEEEDIAENRKHIIICKNRMAKVEKSLGNTDTEKRLNDAALVLARQNLAERGLPEDMRRAAVSIIMIADNLIETEDTFSYYSEARELLEKAASMENDEKIYRNLSIVYNRLGTIALQHGDYQAAASGYIEDWKIAQRLAMESGKPQARQDFAVSCYKLAEVYRIYGEDNLALHYYQMACRTMEYLMQSRRQPDDVRGLIILLNARGKYTGLSTAAASSADLSNGAGTVSSVDISNGAAAVSSADLSNGAAAVSSADISENSAADSSEEAELPEPVKSYRRALDLSREMAAKYGMLRDDLYVAASLANVGIELFAAGDHVGAREKWTEAHGLYEKYSAKEAEEIKRLIANCEV